MAIRLKVQEDKVRLKAGQGEGATLNAVREARPILVNDYDNLINKPSINGVELEGDLTTEDLHIQAGVTSWNGQTGDVVYTPPEAPVQSVNGEVGAVVLTASDVNALPDTTPIPRFTSDLVNDSGFITEITSSDVTSALGYTPYNATNPSGYVNATQAKNAAPVQSVNGQIGAVALDADDVGALPDSTVIPTKTSDLTNDSNFITASQAPVQSVNGQTGAVSLTIPTVPTNVSAFNNDAGYITSAALPTKVSDLTNDSGYLTLATLPIWDGGVI